MIDASQIKIRPADRADVPAIVRMLADDERGKTHEDAGGHIADSYFNAFQAIGADGRNALVVVEGPDGDVIGCLQLTLLISLSYRGGMRALIEDVRVDSAYRGQGIGGLMLRWAIAESRRRGCCMIELFTHESRIEAQRFYKRLGFTDHHVGMRLRLT
jgi:ribosomal protein S18 acetylase RimI-like enzyme